jgi:lipopolysaccharide kinase (Kdo/WaaP) family protein
MKNNVIHKNFTKDKLFFDNIILNFNKDGKPFGSQDRNSIKLFDLNGMTVNVKSFKVPNIFNKIAYKFLRRSKAQRSFEYANKLIDLEIGTPKPISYYEFSTFLFFKKSFYISEHLSYDLTFRELTNNLNYPNHEKILRAFTRFTYKLHKNNINFLDHSPGNTLIQINNGNYKFFLVDLNRMEFKPLDFESRIKNFSKLTIHKPIIEVISNEYAKVLGENYDKVFNLMWKLTKDFQKKYHRKHRLKKKLKFWK